MSRSAAATAAWAGGSCSPANRLGCRRWGRASPCWNARWVRGRAWCARATPSAWTGWSARSGRPPSRGRAARRRSCCGSAPRRCEESQTRPRGPSSPRSSPSGRRTRRLGRESRHAFPCTGPRRPSTRGRCRRRQRRPRRPRSPARGRGGAAAAATAAVTTLAVSKAAVELQVGRVVAMAVVAKAAAWAAKVARVETPWARAARADPAEGWVATPAAGAAGRRRMCRRR
mmetsp:Transcript_7137/g.22825  ORF Transcript_7137/g.22825 Transcript_7137/m.22825 type:complete len:229 (+) Transcript_7137:342-1028(+)